MEKILDFIGYPNYSVDTDGNVFSFKGRSKRKMKPSIMKGYIRVTFSDGGKMKYFNVHRLVALAFIPNSHNKPFIDHIDGNPSNNNVNNLRWCTYKENSNNPISLKRLSESQKGEKSHRYGKHLSESQKQKISSKLKGIKKSDETRNRMSKAKKIYYNGVEREHIQSD